MRRLESSLQIVCPAAMVRESNAFQENRSVPFSRPLFRPMPLSFDRLGTIEEGKEADLVLLAGNPLEDINNTKSRVGVVVDGRWYTNEELFQLLN